MPVEAWGRSRLLSRPLPVAFTAHSRHTFFCRDAVCVATFRRGFVPLNPFRTFDYFLGDRVPRDSIRDANRNLLARADELWVFGPELADGVLEEIELAVLKLSLPVRFFTVCSEPEAIVLLPPGERQRIVPETGVAISPRWLEALIMSAWRDDLQSANGLEIRS
jgi:hypothetical protein